MRCLGVVVGTAWLHATRQFLDTSVFLGGNIMIQIRMQQGLSQDARIIRQEVFPAYIKKGDSTSRQPLTLTFLQTANYLSPAGVPSSLSPLL